MWLWAHAWIVLWETRHLALPHEICYRAYREVDSSLADYDVAQYACPQYDALRQLFTGIQVAGPRLGPRAIEHGFRRIPPVLSTDPRLPTCFYPQGDYSCVKDAMAEWWDPAGDASSQGGCFRMGDHGARFLRGGWPAHDPRQSPAPPHRRDGPSAPSSPFGRALPILR